MLKTTMLDSNVSIEEASMNDNSADTIYLHRMGIDGGFSFPLDGFTDGGMEQERVSVSPF